MKYQFGLSVLFLFGLMNFSSAQIDIAKIDRKLLEHEIKILVDSTRKAHRLSPLFNDSILYVASSHHSNYLVNKGILSHEEKEFKQWYTPQDRASYFGAPPTYFVGENLVYTPYNARVKVKGKTFQTDNYREIARCLVFSWINSKGHFKNMITPDYKITGLAIGVDPKTNRIYACQKFAKVLYQYSFDENELFFPYSKINSDSLNRIHATFSEELTYPHGLKVNKVEKCEECREQWANYPPISVRVQNNYFILRVEDAQFVQELIQNRKDGFAVEIVPFEPFVCGNPAYLGVPSRRNGKKRSSGTILAPVYRDDLVKGFKKRKSKKGVNFVSHLLQADSISFFKRFGTYSLVRFEAKYFEIKLGKLPKEYLNTAWNHNLMYIRDRQICHFVYLTNYPGEIQPEFVETKYYPPVPVNHYQFELEFFRDTTDLFFEPGAIVASGKELDRLMKKYGDAHVTIEKVLIEGSSSVEGKAETNESLHAKRAESILKQLKTLLSPEAEVHTSSSVAWNHFYSKVSGHPKWGFLSQLSREEVSNYLNDPKNERPLEILAEERVVRVVINGVREVNRYNALYYINRDLKSLVYKDVDKKILCRDMERLRLLYQQAYYLTTIDTLSEKDFLSIKIPPFTGGVSHELEHDLVFYRYHLLKDKLVGEELSQLKSKAESLFKKCGAPEHLSSEFQYLTANWMIEKLKSKRGSLTPDNEMIQKVFNRLGILMEWNKSNPDFVADIAKANLNVVNLLIESVDPALVFEYRDVVNNSLIHLVEYYQKNEQMDADRTLKMSKFLCYFQNVPLAIQLCQKHLDNDEVLKLYLVLSYVHSSYLSPMDELNFEKDYHELLMEAHRRFPAKEWCALFYGQNGIPFQIMDKVELRETFCATCPDRVLELLKE